MTLQAARDALAELAVHTPPRPGRVWVEGSTLWIDNPRAKGALTAGMMRDLANAVIQLRSDRGSLVIVRGTPGAFCSGGHLAQVRSSLVEPEQGRVMAQAMTTVLDSLLMLPQVVVAAVNGPALGGGAELLTACDHRVFGPRGRVGFVHARLGVAPGWGGAARLHRLLGSRLALRCLSTAQVLDGEQALEVGLADVWIGDEGDLQEGVEAFVAPIRHSHPAAVRACKEQLNAASPLRRSGEEARLFGTVWGSAEHRRCLSQAVG